MLLCNVVSHWWSQYPELFMQLDNVFNFAWVLWGTSYTPGGWFNIKMPSYQYRKPHYGDKTIFRSSYLHNGISYTGKMSSLYWTMALMIIPLTLFVSSPAGRTWKVDDRPVPSAWTLDVATAAPNMKNCWRRTARNPRLAMILNRHSNYLEFRLVALRHLTLGTVAPV